MIRLGERNVRIGCFLSFFDCRAGNRRQALRIEGDRKGVCPDSFYRGILSQRGGKVERISLRVRPEPEQTPVFYGVIRLLWNGTLFDDLRRDRTAAVRIERQGDALRPFRIDGDVFGERFAEDEQLREPLVCIPSAEQIPFPDRILRPLGDGIRADGLCGHGASAADLKRERVTARRTCGERRG